MYMYGNQVFTFRNGKQYVPVLSLVNLILFGFGRCCAMPLITASVNFKPFILECVLIKTFFPLISQKFL